MFMPIPDAVQTVLRILRQNNFTAVLVGGCVRDACMGLAPHDFDIATSAAPDDVRRCFSAFRTLDTGIRHGTVTVLIEHEPIEVTTFRVDGEYKDHRHPSTVAFTTVLEQDLARRDFTVNAMALDGETLCDPFGGLADIQNRVIRCVGAADKRFDEDGLRILRAMRFASTLRFSVAPETADAIHQYRKLLQCISVERIWTEFQKLLQGEAAPAVLAEFADVLRTFLPEADETGLRRLPLSPPHPAVRLAVLLQNTDAEAALRRLRADKKTIRDVTALCSMETAPLPKMLSVYTPRQVRLFWDVLCARGALSRTEADRLQMETDALLSAKPCLHVRDLAVNGCDLEQLGLHGAQIGKTLQTLLDGVLDGRLQNDKSSLLQAVREH